MTQRIFIKGNDALALGALKSGLEFFAGYPITPASEIPEYLATQYQTDQARIQSGEDPEYPGFSFVQAESEVAAINMVLGAASTGARSMTGSSSPGISLKMEGVSYIHGSQLPGVVINVMRGGPGLGNIAPEQSDYAQAVKGGGHGNYRNIVLAPHTIQEMYDTMPLAFDLAYKYRNLVFILVDGCLGQMQESIIPHPIERPGKHDTADWAVDGDPDRPRRAITSLYIVESRLEQHNLMLKAKYDRIQAAETRAEAYMVDDAEIVCVAYGIVARIVKSAIDALRANGVKVGLVRPQTLWPFPTTAFDDTIETAKAYLAVELSLGQMVEDVRLTVNGRRDVDLLFRTGGMLPTVTEVAERLTAMVARYA
jgi:2-oxoglutarate/2-oxoacid ferredoxin oxidoreductase subunit alpha